MSSSDMAKRVLQESNSISSSSDGNSGNGQSLFSSASVFQRIQKKMVGKVAGKNLVKHFGSDNTSRLFDNLYALLKVRYDKQTAEKVVSNIIKVTLKLGVVTRENDLSNQLLKDISNMQKQLKHVLLIVISYTTLDYSYDYKHLKSEMDKAQALLLKFVKETLSEKSQNRVGHIFSHLGDQDFLDSTMRTGSDHNATMKLISEDLETILDSRHV
ncbi:hypothetical protein L596_010377 [Steinernema carpocapsae]|uniref:Tumor necrosis factor alpha-induced protein 8-like protein n=1 Tax=Steinernema carpocapsae TaxID=34508 RepID=A0A4U5PIM3_STECR|nr:hypothetical protein L596_010377 [Steinernema carpocapsae]